MDSIAVVDWDPSWVMIAAALQAELRSKLPADSLQHLEHIGSTSVPGLAAKPVIDLMASAIDLDRFAAMATGYLDRLDYLPAETGMTERLFYRRALGRTPTVHLHIVTAEAWSTQNERILRDFLVAHPDASRRYGALKLRLAATIDHPLEYTRAKTALIQELVDQARAERELPPVNVWPE